MRGFHITVHYLFCGVILCAVSSLAIILGKTELIAWLIVLEVEATRGPKYILVADIADETH